MSRNSNIEQRKENTQVLSAISTEGALFSFFPSSFSTEHSLKVNAPVSIEKNWKQIFFPLALNNVVNRKCSLFKNSIIEIELKVVKA